MHFCNKWSLNNIQNRYQDQRLEFRSYSSLPCVHLHHWSYPSPLLWPDVTVSTGEVDEYLSPPSEPCVWVPQAKEWLETVEENTSTDGSTCYFWMTGFVTSLLHRQLSVLKTHLLDHIPWKLNVETSSAPGVGVGIRQSWITEYLSKELYFWAHPETAW